MLNSLIEFLELLKKMTLIFIKVFLVLLVVTVVLGPLLPMGGGGHNFKRAQKTLAHSFLQTLQSSAAIYVAQQRTKPESFKDFIVPEGAATGAKTLTLENVRRQLENEKATISDPLVLKFNEGGTATYYLKGKDVTATFEGFE